jgi:hypothetical protein
MVRRPDYVPRDAVYVSSNRTKRRHGASIGSTWVRVLIVVVGLVAVGVACFALWRIGQIEDQERAGWPMVVPSTYAPPAACHGLRAGCS